MLQVFTTDVSIRNTAKYEVHTVIGFLNPIGECLVEIYRQITAVYGDTITQQNVSKWCHEFSEGRTDIHNDQSSIIVMSDDLLHKTEESITSDW